MIDNDNYKTWQEAELKSELYKTLASLVNKDGEVNHKIKRERTALGIGQKMNYFVRNMKKSYTRLENDKKENTMPKKNSKFKYYDYLFSVMEKDLKEHYESLKSKASKVKRKQSTTAAEPCFGSKEAIGAPKMSRDQRMADLEIQHKETILRQEATKVKFENLKMLEEQQRSKKYSMQDIADLFPEFVPLFKGNELTTAGIKKSYNDHATKNNLDISRFHH